VDGGTAQTDPQGTLVTPPPGAPEVTIRLRRPLNDEMRRIG
jgi:hypothetical protein